MTTPTAGLIWLVTAIGAAGAVSGILAGLFGIGGGAVMVPVLFEFFRVLGVPEEVRMQLCIGTSLAIIVPTTVRSYSAHRSRGLVMVEVVRRWTIPSILGVAAGAAAAGTAPPGVFEAAFVLIASIIAAKLLLGRNDWVLSETLPGQVLMSGYGFLVGLASSLMGISGGSLANLILTLYRKPIHNVVATSAGIGVPITIAGTVGYCLAGLPHRAQLPPFSVGFVSIIGIAIMAPISTYIAPLGARLAHSLSRRQLEIGLGAFLLAAAARFALILAWPIL